MTGTFKKKLNDEKEFPKGEQSEHAKTTNNTRSQLSDRTSNAKLLVCNGHATTTTTTTKKKKKGLTTNFPVSWIF
jgi:hypothetical protein